MGQWGTLTLVALVVACARTTDSFPWQRLRDRIVRTFALLAELATVAWIGWLIAASSITKHRALSLIAFAWLPESLLWWGLHSKVTNIFELLEEPILIASPADPITVAQIALWIAHFPPLFHHFLGWLPWP